MKYDYVKMLKPADFKRLSGVKPETFELMLCELREAERKRRGRRGRRFMVSLEDQLLLTLKYWREYPTIFSLATSYHISESTCNRIIHFVEDTLADSDRFKLPGKKKLQDSDWKYEVFLIDATESPIERPKRSSGKKEPQK
jgi:hypothetical protein